MKTIGLAIMAILLFCSQSLSETCDYERQIEVLALNMYHEARGEGLDGMQMVGEVTLNRVEHEYFPDNVCEVVYQRSQFSWTRNNSNTIPSKDDEMWKIALEMAENLINGEIEFFDNGATHFLNPRRVSRMPRWSRNFERVGRVGNHVFYQM